MDNFTAQAREMDAQLDEMVRAMLRLRPKAEPVVAVDPEEQIRVTVAPGGALAAIEVASRWSERIEPDGLAAAVLATIAEAQLEASGLSGDSAEPTEAEVKAKRDEITSRAESILASPASDADLQSRIDHIPALFDQLDDALRRLHSRVEEMAEPVSLAEAEELGLPDEVEGIRYTSDNEMVSITINRGTVVDLSVHQRWAESRSGIAITECFDQIIEKVTEHQTRQGE